METSFLQTAGAMVAAQRRSEIVSKLRRAMIEIDNELLEADGIYLQNRGKLNQRELCRRAGVAHITLHGAAHKTTTLVEIRTWLERKENRTIKQNRTASIDKAAYWKAEHLKLATQICIYELDLKEKDLQIISLKDQIKALQTRESAAKRKRCRS